MSAARLESRRGELRRCSKDRLGEGRRRRTEQIIVSICRQRRWVSMRSSMKEMKFIAEGRCSHCDESVSMDA